MPRFVALLRGVNVGGAKRVPMAAWRTLLEEMGHTGVATLLNSGNAVFDAAQGTPSAHAARIAEAIAAALDVEVPVIVKPARELAAIVAASPFAVDAAHHSRYLAAFTANAASLRTLDAIAPLVSGRERFALGKHAAYLYCPDGILESAAGKALLGRPGGAATTRNWATVLKLHTLAQGGARA